jgi:F-type H+-transporting ATPase subunit alpha
MPVELQVVSVFAGTSGSLDDLPVNAVRRFETELHEYVSTRHAGMLQGIRDTGALPDDDALATVVSDFHDQFVANLAASDESAATAAAAVAANAEAGE